MAEDREKPTADPKAAEASKIIRNHAIAAVATCVVPIPLVGVGMLGGVHLRMIRQLAKLYEVEFSEHRANAIIGSLVGISATATAFGFLRMVPALSVLGALAPSASTYALGKVFIEHFESGGTFLTFDPERAKALHDKALAEKPAEESFAGIKP